MYTPSKEQAEVDRAAAFAARVPHGELQQSLLLLPRHPPAPHAAQHAFRAWHAGAQPGDGLRGLGAPQCTELTGRAQRACLQDPCPASPTRSANAAAPPHLPALRALPAGYVAPGDKYSEGEKLELLVVSDLVSCCPPPPPATRHSYAAAAAEKLATCW
jgi:hypothetical protein